MAIDSSLFVADLPARQYTKGEVVELMIHSGPAVVRDGYGSPRLTNIRTGMMSAGDNAKVPGYFRIRNSNWVDPIINAASAMFSNTALSEKSQGYQYGHQAQLQVNSAWSVEFVVTGTVTSTEPNTLTALVDIDYPSVSAITNPAMETGTPASNAIEVTPTPAVIGSWKSAKWTTKTIDILKAGYRYLLEKAAFYNDDLAGAYGFIRLSGAASQAGLARIIPVIGDLNAAIKGTISSSETFVKGPMDLSVLASFTGSGNVILDWVKR